MFFFKYAHRLVAGSPPIENKFAAGRPTNKNNKKGSKHFHSLAECLNLNTHNAKSH